MVLGKCCYHSWEQTSKSCVHLFVRQVMFLLIICRARFLPLLQAAEPDCLVVVIGMKQDLLTTDNRAVEQKEALILAKEANSRKLDKIPYYEASSVSGHNVDNVFEYIFQTCLPQVSKNSDRLHVSDMKLEEQSQTAKSCSC